ncbi:SIR2 family protein [Oscillospiraceae bacterium CM]|nr:SIR2 family protein [Oscillospiraceae bacterium CM]
MINWPVELIQDIAKRKCVLYLGSGVSANSINDTGKHPATWAKFLTDIVSSKGHLLGTDKDLIISLIAREDYLTSCELIVDHIGERVFGELAADEYRRPGYRHHEIHEVIFSLDSKIVITPNIDKIYEQYASMESHGTIVPKTFYDDDVAKYLRSQDFLIIKAHGTVDSAERIIFTHQQYARARYQFETFYRILDALMLTHTFIFIGCGIADPDIQLVLENYNFSFPKCRPHFFITSEDNFANQISNSLRNNRNLEIITYNNATGDHALLLSGLKDLKDKVENERAVIASITSW